MHDAKVQAAPNLHGFCAVFPRDVFFEAFGAAGGGAGAVTGDTLAGVMKITEGDAMEELRRVVEDKAALREAGVPDHILAHAAAALSGTWSAMPGTGELAQALLGTRPGDPLADIVYGFVVAKIRWRARARLLEAGLVSHAA